MSVKNYILRILKLANKNDCRCDVDLTYSVVVISGPLDELVYCHTNRSRFSMDTCIVVTKLGYYNIVK